LPLYPQYSTTTTKSSLEDFLEVAKDQFEINVIEPFFKNKSYNKIICNHILKTLNKKEPQEYNLILSAHGLPQKVIDKGDPYYSQLVEQDIIIKDIFHSLGVQFRSISLAFQSKVGPMAWLEPSLEDRLSELQNQKVIIYPISFIIDNSETTFELDIEYKHIASKFGIKDYLVCDCLNDDEEFVDTIISEFL
jgi:ferrochelatase